VFADWAAAWPVRGPAAGESDAGDHDSAAAGAPRGAGPTRQLPVINGAAHART